MEHIEEKQRRIAEFMGYLVKENANGVLCVYYKNRFDDWIYSCGLADVTYNVDMDKLLPVTDKIEEMGYEFSYFRGQVNIVKQNDDKIIATGTGNMLDSFYTAIDHFIELYNAGKLPQ